jgi:hypothetical protein
VAEAIVLGLVGSAALIPCILGILAIVTNLPGEEKTPAGIRRAVEEYSHAGLPALRITGGKFATMASQAEGCGNLMLTPEQQSAS